MAWRITYPTAYGFNVLATWPFYGVAPNAVWRPADEVYMAKLFSSERKARSFIAKYFPHIPQANFVIEEV